MKTTVETLVGTLVVLIAAGFLAYAYTAGEVKTVTGYKVEASFDRIDGISVGTDVRISGIKIGSVTETILDPQTYLAKVTMNIDKNVQLPDDSSVKVAMDGLLGGSYLAVQPGGSETMLADGGEITYTQPSIDIVGLLGQAIFSPTSSSGGSSSTPPAPPSGGAMP